LFLYTTRLLAPEVLVLYRNAADFAETQVTWQSQPPAADTPPQLWEAPPGLHWMVRDVSAFVDDCWQVRGGSCSWQVRSVNEVDNTVEKRVVWASRENENIDRVPRLEVLYAE
jgi:hypothetical protein